MRQAIIRTTIYVLALCLLGPIAGTLTGALRAADGSHAASPLFCTTPALGLLCGIGALVIALLLGLIASRLVSVACGFTAAGLVMAWAAWRTGQIDDMIRTSQSGQPLLSQCLEGVVFGALGLGVAVAIWVVGKRETHAHDQPKSPDDAIFELLSKGIAAAFLKVFRGRGGATVIPVALIAGAAAAWFIGVSPLKGQAVFAAITAGVLAAAAGRLVDADVSLPSLVLPVVALAVLGPLSGYAIAGGGATQIVAASYKNALFPVANITALDWVAGAMLGVPIGVAWAGSMLEKHHPPA